MRAAGLIHTGLACAAVALAVTCGPVAAQSLLTYPGGMSTMMPPPAAPAQVPPAALVAPPAIPVPAPAQAAPPQAAPPQAAPAPAAATPVPQLAAPQAGTPQPMSSCDMDMMKLQEKRNATMTKVNAAVKPNKKGQVNPLVACPNLRQLVSVETEMKTWMTKNQDWCSIPDQVMTQMRDGFSKTAEIADRACAAAAQVRKAQKQMQAGGAAGPGRPPAPKLPAGPL